MSDATVQVMVAAFHRQDAAPRALRALRDAHGETPPWLLDVAAVARGADGRLRVVEARERRGGADFALGALAAGVLGLLAGSAGDEAIGRLAETLRRGGMETDRLRRLGAALTEWSAVVAVVERRWTMRLAHVVGGLAYAFVIESLPDGVVRELRAVPDLRYPPDDDGEAGRASAGGTWPPRGRRGAAGRPPAA